MNFLKTYANLLIGVIVVALAAAGAFGLRSYKEGLREEGRAEIRAALQYATSAALIEREKEITRLVGITRNWSEINENYLAQIDALRSARAADAGRLQRPTSERRAAIAAASDVPALRAYPTTAGDIYERSRAEYRGLGFRADECAAAAHTLKGWTDEVTKIPRTPTSPFTKPTQD